MRIGFFTNTYLPINYGSTVSVETFRKSLEKLGEEVFVFAPQYEDYDDKNESVFRYPSIMYNYKGKYPIAIPFYPPINKKIKELKLDIIHAHQPFSLGREGLRLAKKHSIPIIFTHHTRYEDYVHYVPMLPESVLANLVKKEATRFANQCDLVIAPSESIKQMIISRGVKTQVKVLPTGIEADKFQSGRRKKIRKKFHIEESENLLLNVGRIEEEKNISFLFECAAGIMKKNKKTKLMFVGGGSLKETIKEKAAKMKIKNRVIFAGLVDREEIQDYFAAGDVYLQASTSETQGLSLYEAMASGLPCVAVESTGSMDAVDSGKDGILVKENKKQFQSAVEDLIQDGSKRKRLSKEAAKKARKNDVVHQAKKLQQYYWKVIQEKQLKKKFAPL